MAETNNQAVEFVSYNESDVDRLQKRQVYNNGVYQFVLSAPRRYVDKDGDLNLVVPLRATDREGRAKGPVIERYLHLLVSNPTVPGHAPNLRDDNGFQDKQKNREFIRAVLGDDALPHYPKKEGTKFIDPATGEEMSDAARKARAREIDAMTNKMLLKWYNKDPETGSEGGAELEGVGVYGGVTRSKSNPARAYVNYVRSTPPEGKEVKYEDFTSLVD